jgi:protease-4
MDDQIPPQQGTPPAQPPPPPPSQAVPPPLPPPPVICTPPPARSGTSPVWKVLAIVFLVLLVVSFLIHSLNFTKVVVNPRTRTFSSDRSHSLEEVTLEQTNGDNKIAVISVSGIISGGEDADRGGLGLVEFINEQLKQAQSDTDVKAVILKINSPGGEVLASDEINKAIAKFQEDSGKPVVVSMGALAASGGYYISVPCRWIVANELTITGSIGVILDTWNYRQLMDKIGIRPHAFKSGRFKDMLSGEREPDTDKLSPEEQKTRQEEDEMVQSLINETYDQFKGVVQSGRDNAAKLNAGAGRRLVDNWQDYADGRVLSGKHALELGFVDELGDFHTAVNRAEKLAGISSASLVEYHVVVDFQSVISRLFAKSDAPVVKVDLGFTPPQLKAGLPYYILPIAVLH